MKRSIEALVIVPMLLAIVAMAIVGVCGIARAEPVDQLSVLVNGARPNALTVQLHLRRYDTTGGVPPLPTAFELQLPDVRLDPAFLTARYECDGRALRDALDAHLSGTPFMRRVRHLGGFERELARSHAARDRVALANARACARGRLGAGTGVIDARDVIRVLTDPIPFSFSVFLGRGTAPGAIASLVAIGAADPGASIVRRYPVVANVHAVEIENVVPARTADGRRALKIDFDVGPLNGFHVSRAQIDATVHQLAGRGGEVLFELPRCPASGRYSGEALTSYAPPTPSVTTLLEVPCPPFVS
jgi:hypothetical protein